jgi:hypothetical protein
VVPLKVFGSPPMADGSWPMAGLDQASQGDSQPQLRFLSLACAALLCCMCLAHESYRD